ncbi:MAG: hypothetical protein ABI867_38940 [Kofleriaceae bacterium]
MNIKGFFVTALSQALDLGIATPDDVVRHVTPDMLAAHLPRPLWARLLTACLGAPRVDATLVVETIGVPNLCEHIPEPVIWACIGEIAQRALDQEITWEPVPVGTTPTHSAVPTPIVTRPSSQPVHAPLAMSAPPPLEPRSTPPTPTPVAVGPSIPAPSQSLADVVAALESDGSTPPTRSRTPTGQRFRQSNTGIGRLAANNTRRPQAAAGPPTEPTPTATVPARRGSTDAEYEVETEVGKDDWKNALAVEDEQLVDWSAAEETVTHGDPRTGGNNDGYGRKR